MEFPLVRVTPSYRGVVLADVEDIWEIVKVWTPSLWITELKGIPCSFHLLIGDSGEQVGAERATVVGSGVVVEKLVAVDAEEHYLTWRCIADPRSVNPFPGNFVDYINTLRFTPLTAPGKTAVEWQDCAAIGLGWDKDIGEFWTDVDMEVTMHDLLAEFYDNALQSLERQLNRQKTEEDLNGRIAVATRPGRLYRKS